RSEFERMEIDTSKILLLSVQYLDGINGAQASSLFRWRGGRAAFRKSRRTIAYRAAGAVAANPGSREGGGLPPVRTIASGSATERSRKGVLERCATHLAGRR